jgi:hypothetical protein
MSFTAVVFFLCMLTSAACMVLLVRGWRSTRAKLLLWSSLCFVFLAINNLLVFVDIIVLPYSVDLLPFRQAASLAAVSVLLYGFIWEAD